MPRHNRIALTDRAIRAAKVQPGRATADLFDGLCPGLVLRVSATGRRVWYATYRKPGQKNKTWTPVVDPQSGSNVYPILELGPARALAAELLKVAGTGKDPRAVVAAAKTKQVEQAARTWTDLGKLYIDVWARPRKKTWKDDQADIKKQLAVWANVPVVETTRQDVRRLTAAIIARGAPTRANRIHSLISKMLWVAFDHEWVPANVTARMGKPSLENKRKRRLSDEEVAKFWVWLNRPAPDALDEVTRNNWVLYRAMLKLRLLTAARGNEILNMRWDDLKWSTNDQGPWWEIPETKNGLAHRLPLTTLAIQVLRDLMARATDLDPETFVFAGIRGKRQQRGFLVDLPFRKTAEGFKPRDLRRTVTTNLAALGVTRFDVRRVLNHADTEVTGDYDLFAYGPEKRAALDKWDARLTVLITPPSPLRLVESA
jgi:integrase